MSAVATGLVNPWSLAFLPNGDILVTERPGRLRIVRNGVLDPTPIAGVPVPHVAALAGLLEVALHPRFAENRIVYLTYSKGRAEDKRSTTALARATFDGTALVGLKDIFVANTWSVSNTNYGGRIAFDRAGFLYLTAGERQEQDRAQKPEEHAGKVLRLRDDGTAPPDNPFAGKPGYQPEIYTTGHRSPQGLALNPETGELWENEHGPLGGDELNILKPGANYGWPLVTYGTDYDGTKISDLTTRPDLESPFMYWVPSIAISGLTFYTGDRLPGVEGQRLRRLDVRRAHARHGPSGAHHVQQGAPDPARADPRRAETAHPRRAAGSRWPALRADRRAQRHPPQDRTGVVTRSCHARTPRAGSIVALPLRPPASRRCRRARRRRGRRSRRPTPPACRWDTCTTGCATWRRTGSSGWRSAASRWRSTPSSRFAAPGRVILRFQDVLVVLDPGETTGGTEGSVVNHVAFRIPSLAPVEAAGLTAARLAQFPGVSSVMSPENERIELFENSATNLTFAPDGGIRDAAAERHNRPLTVPVAFHHVHLYVPDAAAAVAAKAWYARMFGGVPGKRAQYDATDVPGINLNFSAAPGARRCRRRGVCSTTSDSKWCSCGRSASGSRAWAWCSTSTTPRGATASDARR